MGDAYTVSSVPPDRYAEFKRWAASEFGGIDGYVDYIRCVGACLASRPRWF
jgi:hypothetical protein